MNNKIELARKLRKRMTDAEIKLWQGLRRKQINGYRFRKQVPLGNYIVDFICYESRLIIELDGGQHNEIEIIEYDTQRTKWLESQGYVVKRFWNNEVLQETESVLEAIWDSCKSRNTPLPILPPQGGKGPVAKMPS